MRVVHAVVGIVHDGEWFILLKKQGTWVGWQFAQGSLNTEETKEQAVLREIKEETGLDGVIEKQLRFRRDYWHVEVDGERIHKYLTFFIVKARMNDKVKLSEEHSGYEWHKKENVLKLLTYNKDVFKEVAKRYFK